MKQFKCFAIFALSIQLLTSSCMAQRTESNSSSQRNVSDFTTINISGGFEKATLSKGEPGVRIIADERFLPWIITNTEDGDLNISIKRGAPSDLRASLEVSYRQVKELNNSGSTDLVTMNAISAKTLTINFSGSGDFNGEIDVNTLEANISGSSDFTLRGKADSQSYSISGSGDVQASQLRGSDAEVAISGSGDVELNINGNVQTSSSGSGSVRNRN